MSFVFVVQPQVRVFAKRWFLVRFEANVLAPAECGPQGVLVLSLPSDQLVPHPVVDIEEVVGVFTCIFLHLRREGPTDKMKE